MSPATASAPQSLPETVHLDGYALSAYRFPARTELPEHSHFNASMNLLVQGSVTEFASDLERPFDGMRCSYYPPCHTHRVEVGAAETIGFHVELTPPWLERVIEHLEVPAIAPHRNCGELAWLLTRLYLEFRRPDSVSRLAIEGLLLESLACVARSAERCRGREPRWLRIVTRLLEAEFKNPPGLDQLGDVAGVHPVHLSRAFRRFRGMGPAEYVRRLRIHFACSELLRRDVRLIDLASEAGFADQSHFTRSFKLITGMTPRAFRRRLGRDPR